MDGDKGKQPWQHLINMTVISILSQVGCVTFVISLIALLGGLWLDNLLGTRPILTMIFVAISMPVVMYTIYKITMAGTRHLKTFDSGKDNKK
jgi:MFS-type transporter involved in bile tolerance (Atg22 family)